MIIWDPISKGKVGRHHLFNQKPTYRRTKVKKRKNKWETMFLIETKVWATGTPVKLELETTDQDGKQGFGHKWHSWCYWRKQPVICHTWWQVMSKDNMNDRQSVQTEHITVHSWQRLNKGKHNSLRRSSWGRTSIQPRDELFICRCCWNVATYKWKIHNLKI
jgi:hypothetical protein